MTNGIIAPIPARMHSSARYAAGLWFPQVQEAAIETIAPIAYPVFIWTTNRETVGLNVMDGWIPSVYGSGKMENGQLYTGADAAARSGRIGLQQMTIP